MAVWMIRVPILVKEHVKNSLRPFSKALGTSCHTASMSAITIKRAIPAHMLPRSTRYASNLQGPGQPDDEWGTGT